MSNKLGYRRLNQEQSGFTIIELLIATTVFTMVLLVCAVAIVHVGRMYFKGAIMSRTQDTSRRLGEDISQAIQFGPSALSDTLFRRMGGPIDVTAGTQTVSAESLCLGDIQYTFTRSRSLGNGDDQSKHVLWKNRIPSTDPDCDPQNLALDEPFAGGEEFLAENMRIADLSVAPDGNGLYAINLIVSYGVTADLFETSTPPFSICKGVAAGGQFCATSIYNTTVGKRL